MGRPKNIHTPIKHFTEEDRKKAITQSKTKYTLNKEWICHECGNRNYTLSGKWNRIKTKKHMRNAEAMNNNKQDEDDGYGVIVLRRNKHPSFIKL